MVWKKKMKRLKIDAVRGLLTWIFLERNHQILFLSFCSYYQRKQMTKLNIQCSNHLLVWESHQKKCWQQSKTIYKNANIIVAANVVKKSKSWNWYLPLHRCRRYIVVNVVDAACFFRVGIIVVVSVMMMMMMMIIILI